MGRLGKPQETSVVYFDILSASSKKLLWFEQSRHEPFIDESMRRGQLVYSAAHAHHPATPVPQQIPPCLVRRRGVILNEGGTLLTAAIIHQGWQIPDSLSLTWHQSARAALFLKPIGTRLISPDTPKSGGTRVFGSPSITTCQVLPVRLHPFSSVTWRQALRRSASVRAA